MDVLYVPFDSVSCVKTLAAVLTAIGFYIGMSLRMCLKAFIGFRCVITYAAREEFLPSVTEHVPFKTSGISAPVITQFAHVGLFARMLSYVYFYVVLLSGSVIAEVASKRLLARVNSQMFV